LADNTIGLKKFRIFSRFSTRSTSKMFKPSLNGWPSGNASLQFKINGEHNWSGTIPIAHHTSYA
jgi:hypothetical protein